MKVKVLFVAAFALFALTGCTKTGETPQVDPATAKAQPGADTPPATAAPGAPSEAQVRAEKEGK